MALMLPIHKQYSDLIFSGEKFLEFRNYRMKIEDGETAFVYETKKGGCGMVVGRFTCGTMTEIPRTKIGTYNFLQQYVERFGNEEEKEAVKLAMQVHYKNHDDSLVLDYLFCDELLKKMIITGEPISSFEELLENVGEYYKTKERQNELYSRCDHWLKRIGFYNEYDESTWKYYIPIRDVEEFPFPEPITNFCLLNGKKILKAPQGFCYCCKCENKF